jgi:hypothetical protein
MTFTRVPINFGPNGCPDARLWLHDHWRVGSILEQCWGIHVSSGNNVEWTKPAQKQEIIQQEMKSADLYWIGNSMCDMVNEAKQTVPMDVSLAPEIIPTPRGLAFFESSLIGTDAMHAMVRDESASDGDGDELTFDAIHWFPSLRRDSRGEWHFEMSIDFYTSTDNTAAKFIYVGGSQWGIGEAVGDTDHDDGTPSSDVRRKSFIEDRTLLVALLGLIASPGVADVSEYAPNRAERRRSQRAGIDLGAVRIINLRGASGGEDGSGDSNYRHRWMVSGHWRSQPYGPGRTLRKPVWIAPHIKGPDGAPLLHGEKVRVLR